MVLLLLSLLPRYHTVFPANVAHRLLSSSPPISLQSHCFYLLCFLAQGDVEIVAAPTFRLLMEIKNELIYG